VELGEQIGLALRERAVFAVPASIREAAAKLRAQAMEGVPSEAQVIGEPERGLYARISLHLSMAQQPAPFTFNSTTAARAPIATGRSRRRRSRYSPGYPRGSARSRCGFVRVLSNAQIAAELHRSPLTIKTQLNTIYGKLGVHSRTKASALLNR